MKMHAGREAGCSRNPFSKTNRSIVDVQDADIDALQPDRGTETDFEVENNPFAFSPGQLSKLLNPKSLSAFHAIGGISGIEKGLRTDIQAGLRIDETHVSPIPFEEVEDAASGGGGGAPALQHLKEQGSTATGAVTNKRFVDEEGGFSGGRLPKKRHRPSFFELLWHVYNDKVLILLSLAAAISLALGIYRRPYYDDDAGIISFISSAFKCLADGVALSSAVSVGVWQTARRFARPDLRKQEERTVKATRSGKTVEVRACDLLVGDVVLLEPGDVVVADGVLIDGFNVKCDESSVTGESDVIRKHPDSSIMSGSRILEGIGRYHITTSGLDSYHAHMLESAQDGQIFGSLSPSQRIVAIIAGLAFFSYPVALLVLPREQFSAWFTDGPFSIRSVITAAALVVMAPEYIAAFGACAISLTSARCSDPSSTVKAASEVLVACCADYLVDPDSRDGMDVLSPQELLMVRNTLRKSKISTRMVTGDNVSTAMAIANECGITSQGHAAPQFQVLSPEAKAKLIRRLKAMGEPISIPDDFAMSVDAIGLAKEASQIVLIDDNFTPIIKAIQWARLINDEAKMALASLANINIDVIAALLEFSMASCHPFMLALVLYSEAIMSIRSILASTFDPPRHTNLNASPRPTKNRPSRARRLSLPQSILACVVFSLPVVSAASVLAHPGFRIGSGVVAAGSSVAVIPLRTIEGVPNFGWIMQVPSIPATYRLLLVCIKD